MGTLRHITVYFPTIDPSSKAGELRRIDALFTPGPESRREILPAPSNSPDERTQIELALASLDYWSRAAPARRAGAERCGELRLDVSSKRASTDSSLQLAIAAAAWAARLMAAGVERPRALLVATGSLTDANTVAAEASLRVEIVGGVAKKAALALKELQPGGTLEQMIAPASESGYAGCQVMFAYPALAADDPAAKQQLDDLRKAGVVLMPVKAFGELLECWLPEGADAGQPPVTQTVASRTGRRVGVAAAVLLGSAAATVAGLAGLAPARLEAAVGHMVVPAELRSLTASSLRQPDDEAQGCAALLRQTLPADGAYGWGVVQARAASCRALAACDRGAASPLARPDGLLLRQMAGNREQLADTRRDCAVAEAAWPSLPRLPFEHYRALRAGDEPALAVERQQALQRAFDLGDSEARVETWRLATLRDPELVRQQLAVLSDGDAAHPDALRTLGELLACGQLPRAGQTRGALPAPAEAQLAADLFARATSLPLAAAMAGTERDRLARLATQLRGIAESGTPALPAWCKEVSASLAAS